MERLISPAEVVKILAAEFPALVIEQVPGYEDLIFLHKIGSLDWRWAASDAFQRVIDEHGTEAEKHRLAAMNVGYVYPKTER